MDAIADRSGYHMRANRLIDLLPMESLRARALPVAEESAKEKLPRWRAAVRDGRIKSSASESKWLAKKTQEILDKHMYAYRRWATERLVSLLRSAHNTIEEVTGKDAWRSEVHPAMARWALAHAEHAEMVAIHRTYTGDTSESNMPPRLAEAVALARAEAGRLAWELCRKARITSPLLKDGMACDGSGFNGLGADIVHHVRNAYADETDPAVRQRMRGMVTAAIHAGTGACRRADLDANSEILEAEKAAAPAPRGP